MIRYRYAQQLQPPAPFVYVRLTCPSTGIQVHDLPPSLTRAVLGKKEPHLLLGRDVLNAYRILLDGPQLALEIDS